jgi:hypothetical protein
MVLSGGLATLPFRRGLRELDTGCVLDSQAAASMMRSALDTKSAFGNQALTNGNESSVSGADGKSYPDFLSSELNTHIYEYNP